MPGRLCYRAPTKVILLGEHFVVKGVPGLSTAVGLYAYACAEKHAGPLVLTARDYNVTCRLYPDSDCPSVFAGLARIAEELDARGLRVVVWSEAPPGRGLGSSAAVSVAFAAVLLEETRGEAPPTEVERLAWIAERVHHGRPSGIDHTTSIEGGFLLFHARGVYERLVAPCNVMLVIADTGVERSTRRAVEAVLGRYERLAASARLLYHAAWHAVEEGVRALRECRLERLGEVMDYVHGLLYAMGVSHESIERLLWAARRSGALGAKLTGAGMGGIVIALVPDVDAGLHVAEAMRRHGATWVRLVKAGANGYERVEPRSR